MLHEILLALLGIPGNLIVEEEDSFKISPFINFLTESEKELINRLVILGFYYKKILAFLDFNT
jgi:gamma-tubulin complex component 4